MNQPKNGKWVLKGATEALKENLRKYGAEKTLIAISN